MKIIKSKLYIPEDKEEGDQEDKILSGYVTMLKHILQIKPNLKEEYTGCSMMESGTYADEFNLLHELYRNLFPDEENDSELRAKHLKRNALFNNKLTKKKVLDLMLVLCFKNGKNYTQMIEILCTHHQSVFKTSSQKLNPSK
jgi:hypothetical protein